MNCLTKWDWRQQWKKLEFLNKVVKPILVAGPKLRVEKACKAFIEDHKHFIGTFWGAVSTAFLARSRSVL